MGVAKPSLGVAKPPLPSSGCWLKEAQGSGDPDLGFANGSSNGFSSSLRVEGASKSSKPSILSSTGVAYCESVGASRVSV